MAQANPEPEQEPEYEYECECGYRCSGNTRAAKILDAQRHAREAHGIDVTPQQVQSSGSTSG